MAKTMLLEVFNKIFFRFPISRMLYGEKFHDFYFCTEFKVEREKQNGHGSFWRLVLLLENFPYSLEGKDRQGRPSKQTKNSVQILSFSSSDFWFGICEVIVPKLNYMFMCSTVRPHRSYGFQTWSCQRKARSSYAMELQGIWWGGYDRSWIRKQVSQCFSGHCYSEHSGI